ncbi:MAG: hypothetical protein IPJ40_05425 [Saprospirales bacterium]|nr:hypothetical protein [Saprospirales bacterium]
MDSIKRSTIRLKADPRRVVLNFLDFGRAERFEPVVAYVLGLDDQAVESQLEGIYAEFERRHYDLDGVFLKNYERLITFVSGEPSSGQKRLLGAYFSHEYSVEAAALFNPSIVPHPDQSGLKEGELRFILSLRATGEGHISSIAFQTGVIGLDGEIQLDPRAEKLSSGNKKADSWPDKPDAQHDNLNYTLEFDPKVPLSGRILFPKSASESNGMEDARFVRFTDGKEQVYLGTYTAYSGRAIRPQLIETHDFQHFRIRPFCGKAASDKGMALFPKK